MTASRDFEQTVRMAVRFSDLDVAGHVNNVAWMRFVQVGVSQVLAARRAGASGRPGHAWDHRERGWLWADVRYHRAVREAGTPITVRAWAVDHRDGVLVACEVGAGTPDGRLVGCVTAQVRVGPPGPAGLPARATARLGPGPAPPAGQWPWSLVVPVRPTDQAHGGSLAPLGAADLLQEARHDAVSSWRHGIDGRLVVARTVLELTQASLGTRIRLDSRCSRIGRASFDLASRAVELASGAVVVSSTTRVARIRSDSDQSAAPWSAAERALLSEVQRGVGPGSPGPVAPIGHAPSGGCGQMDI
ncbi:hypothetical protein C5N14_21640 [Micromonospora sp. MW-13]|uniref:acyl-CoA thioesterase n=1 Tax=Micromonospora sp. MW-13 TaxID=2094022 RepID=UPI000E44B363|nr:acyl-CoA thioesterase [Micromonospora sp. MW-13]RGC66813.1 hypothetical protein C5N14_21640 [Micromonospora sp. MW-13]